tara:strand:- start:6518 stop:6754 length:237 start_codon:yes stop_codon:yes gene_type:complete
MKFLDKTVILTDYKNDSVCFFVDKVEYIKETQFERHLHGDVDTVLVGMVSGDVHRFDNQTICSLLRMIKMGCEECGDV